MKSFKYSLIILVIFLKTGNVLSEKNLFNVNNIEINNQLSSNNEILANKAIKKAFQNLIERLILDKDIATLERLKFNQIKELVAYYQILEKTNEEKDQVKSFNIFFDKDKLHDLFYQKGILYSDISKNELYLLPILKKESQFFIYSQNYFYEKWNKIDQNELIEFILPIENIETLQKVNANKNNIMDLDIREIFQEYSGKNLAIVFIEDSKSSSNKIFLKTKIMGKNINKSIIIKKGDLDENNFNNKIILDVKKEITNLFKLNNLIDVRTPSFINTEFRLNKKNNLVELNKRMKRIEAIENIFVREFNNKFVIIKIKYLGKIDKIIEQLKNEKVILRFSNDKWRIKII